MTDITITCYVGHQYAVIRNAGPKGRSNAVAAFLQCLAAKGAFVTLSDGPMANAHGLQLRRIEGFIAHAKECGFIAA